MLVLKVSTGGEREVGTTKKIHIEREFHEPYFTTINKESAMSSAPRAGPMQFIFTDVKCISLYYLTPLNYGPK